MMVAALALAERGRGRTAPNPNVGCVIVKDGHVIGRGWTQPGGRPHAEAMALAEAGDAAKGATLYATLEPCAHVSPRGPACADLIVAAKPTRVVVAIGDPDPRTAGEGFARLRAAGIFVDEGVLAAEARRTMAGFLTRQRLGRPFITLKLATSLDGAIAMASGESRWITGPEARAHVHLERSRHEAILVGRGTWETDRPGLDVRLPGLEGRSPLRLVLTSSPPRRQGPMSVLTDANPGDERDRPLPSQGRRVKIIESLQAIATLPNIDHLFVEGGARTASTFLAADLVDRLLLYRAPILIGGGKPALHEIGLARLPDAHGRWLLADSRMLGSDRLEVYERQRS